MPVGYPDGTRVQQAQDLSIAWSLSGTFNASQNSPAIYVGNHTSVVGAVLMQAGSARLVFNWFADQALTIPLGATTIGLHSFVTVSAPVFVTAGGPWLQLSMVLDAGVASMQFQANLFLGTQYRSHRYQASSVAALEVGQTISHLAPLIAPFAAYSSGRHSVLVGGGSQGVKVEVDYWQNIGQAWAGLLIYTVAANVKDYREVLIPAAACRVVLTDVSTTVDSTSAGIIVIAEQ